MNRAVSIAVVRWFLAGASVAALPGIDDVTFASHGATLWGSIVWPADALPIAAVVLVHGSGPHQNWDTRDLTREQCALGSTRQILARSIAAPA